MNAKIPTTEIDTVYSTIVCGAGNIMASVRTAINDGYRSLDIVFMCSLHWNINQSFVPEQVPALLTLLSLCRGTYEKRTGLKTEEGCSTQRIPT